MMDSEKKIKRDELKSVGAIFKGRAWFWGDNYLADNCLDAWEEMDKIIFKVIRHKKYDAKLRNGKVVYAEILKSEKIMQEEQDAWNLFNRQMGK